MRKQRAKARHLFNDMGEGVAWDGFRSFAFLSSEMGELVGSCSCEFRRWHTLERRKKTRQRPLLQHLPNPAMLRWGHSSLFETRYLRTRPRTREQCLKRCHNLHTCEAINMVIGESKR
jgi:hypothetical protein